MKSSRVAVSSRTRDHYDKLLAKHYTWMFGRSYPEKVAEQRKLLREFGFSRCAPGVAIDLGCGSGLQTVALAELGFSPVLAIDTSRPLLNEVREHAGPHAIRAVCADLRDLAKVAFSEVNAAVCMGDTLTHLPRHADVKTLFADVFAMLRPHGLFALTFRDLSKEVTGLDRIVPINSDNDRIMTCLLDYEPDHVVVTDLIYERTDAAWSLQKHSYKKLRIAPSFVAEGLAQAGFVIERNGSLGHLHAIVAARP